MIEEELHADVLRSAYRHFQTLAKESYDEVFTQVHELYIQNGAIGKLEIGALMMWKRLNLNTTWTARLNETPDDEVRRQTREALAILNANEDPTVAMTKARTSLRVLPGFGGPAVVSTVVSVADPVRFAVYDRNAHAAVVDVLGLQLKKGYLGEYTSVVTRLRHLVGGNDAPWPARHIDLALYTLGQKEQRRPA